MNRYQKIFNKYQLDNKVKDEIYQKINRTKSFKLSYAVIILGIICIVSLSTVYAKDIGNLIKTWFKSDSYVNEDIPDDANTAVISKVTKFDRLKLEKDGNGFTESVIREDLSITQIEDEVGVDLLKYKNVKALYRLDGTNNDEGYVSKIDISYNPLFEDKECFVRLSARIFTKNFDDDALLNDYWFGYIAKDDNKKNYQEIKLDNLGLMAIYYEIGNNYLYFDDDGIMYILEGSGIKMDDFIKIAQDLER